MTRTPGRWSVGTLLVSWAVTWIATAAIKLGPAIAAGVRAANGPEGQGNIGVNFDGTNVHASVTERGVESWAGSASAFTIALWIAVPALVLWALWMFANARAGTEKSHAPAELGEGAFESTVAHPRGQEIRVDTPV